MKLKIYFFILIPMLIWSTHSVFSKYVLSQGVGVFEIIFYKAIGALLVFSFLFSYRRLKSHTAEKWVPGLIFFVNAIAFGYALKYIDAYVVMVLETSCFIFSYLLDRFLKKQVRLSTVATIAFLAGVGILLSYGTFEGNATLLMGVLLAIIASLTLGFFNSTLYLIADEKDKNVLIMLPMLVLSLPIALYEMTLSSLAYYEIFSLIMILGVLQTGVSIYFLTKASLHFSGTTLSIFFLLTLPGTFLTEWIFMSVNYNSLIILASFLIVLSVVLNVYATMGASEINESK